MFDRLLGNAGVLNRRNGEGLRATARDDEEFQIGFKVMREHFSLLIGDWYL